MLIKYNNVLAQDLSSRLYGVGYIQYSNAAFDLTHEPELRMMYLFEL